MMAYLGAKQAGFLAALGMTHRGFDRPDRPDRLTAPTA
jgi:hypothetical protein